MAQLRLNRQAQPAPAPSAALRVGFVGTGRAGASIARSLVRAGASITLASRGASAERLGEELGVAPLSAADVLAAADLTLLAVPDGQLAGVARALAKTAPEGVGQVVAHLAGSLGVDVLEPLRERGYDIAAVHPLQVLSGWRIPPGTTFAVEADGAARPVVARLVTALGGVELSLPQGSRAAYHGAAVIAANLGMSLLAEAVDMLERAGIDREPALDGLAGLVRGGLEASVDRGLPAALTGPVTRGDTETVAAHLQTVAGDPELAAAYRAVSRLALRQALRDGRPDETAARRLVHMLEDPK